jgi:AraC family transcriptional regulator of arabinose operon
MTESAEKTPIQVAARAFYRWFHGEDPEPGSIPAIQAFLGSPISADELQRLGERLQENREFLEAQEPLIDKWRLRMESPDGLTDDEAAGLIQELFSGFDHALLYEKDIRASSTLVHRGQINSSESRIEEMPCWTLHLNLSGGGLFLSDRMEYRVGPGDMMLMRPDAKYYCGLHPLEEHWQHLWALFQPRPHWTELLAWQELDKGILLLSLPEGEGRSHVERLFRELIELGNAGASEQSNLQHNKLEELLIRARSYAEPADPVPVDPRIRQACEYMQRRLGEKFNIAQVAAECNLSTSRFAHLFREQMGMGPKSWINDTRLQQARKLLLTTGRGVASIGAQVGYEDPAHFTRYFRKNMGCSPRQFRKTFRDGA